MFKVVAKSNKNPDGRIIWIGYTQQAAANIQDNLLIPCMEHIYPNEKLEAYVLEDAGGATRMVLVIRNIPRRRRRRR